jgi:hypothetical protein
MLFLRQDTLSATQSVGSARRSPSAMGSRVLR